MIKLSDRAVDLLLYSVSAAFALVTALTSTLLPHRAWGAVAAWGYLAAALLVYAVRRRDLLTWAAWTAVALLPLVDRRILPEKADIVAEAAKRLLVHLASGGRKRRGRVRVRHRDLAAMGWRPATRGGTTW